MSAFLVIIGAVAPGCARSSGKETRQAGRGGRSDAVPVSVAKVSQKDVPVEIQVIGNVEAYSSVSIKAQVTGPLMRVHFREGDYVGKGDLLFTIDPAPFQAQLSEAEANQARNEALLAQAQANLKRDSSQATYLQAQAARYGSLFREGIMSREQSEQIQANADAQAQAVRADEAAIKSAEASIVAARATVQNSRIQLGYTTIRAPVGGRTGAVAVKEGNLVAANSSDLATINQVQPIYVTFSVPEGNLTAIKGYLARGKVYVTASPQDGQGPDETGVLTFVDNNVDTATGTIKLKATFANPDRKLWPGEFVRVTVRLAMESGALVVPNQAVQIGQDGPFVYVVKQDHSVEARPVSTGARVGQDIVIASGLRPEETVVTEGQLRLAAGMRVRLRGEGAPGGRGGGPRSGGRQRPQ